METSVRKCEICSEENGTLYHYYTAEQIPGTSPNARNAAYTNFKRHECYVCNKCRKKGRWSTFFTMLIVGAGAWLLFYLMSALLGFYFVILPIAGVVCPIMAPFSLIRKDGAQAAINKYKAMDKRLGIRYFTEKEFKKYNAKTPVTFVDAPNLLSDDAGRAVSPSSGTYTNNH